MEKSREYEFIFPFEKLEVWQLAVEFADFILGLLESSPSNKHFRLIGQMEAAASSIAQNIAEGIRKTVQEGVHSVSLYCRRIAFFKY